MMWFAYGNERYHRKDQGAADESESGEATKEWLTRMEYREYVPMFSLNMLYWMTVVQTD